MAAAEDGVRLFEILGLNRRPPSADTAKQRLQLVIAHDKGSGGFEFLPLLQRELLEVIKKYVEIDVAQGEGRHRARRPDVDPRAERRAAVDDGAPAAGVTQSRAGGMAGLWRKSRHGSVALG